MRFAPHASRGHDSMASDHDAYQRANLAEVLDSRLAEAERACEQLDNSCQVLPRVDEDGKSECDFAETLYAQKEHAAFKVRRILNKFRDHERAIAAEIVHARENHGKLETARNEVHGTTPRTSLARGSRAALDMHSKLARQHEDVCRMIARLNEVLQESEKKCWPRGRPQAMGPRWHGGAPSAPAEGGHGPLPSHTVPDELDAMLRSGPNRLNP